MSRLHLPESATVISETWSRGSLDGEMLAVTCTEQELADAFDIDGEYPDGLVSFPLRRVAGGTATAEDSSFNDHWKEDDGTHIIEMSEEQYDRVRENFSQLL